MSKPRSKNLFGCNRYGTRRFSAWLEAARSAMITGFDPKHSLKPNLTSLEPRGCLSRATLERNKSRVRARHASNAPRPVLAADLFSGAGGFSKAAENVGIQVKVAVESDLHACETYRRNFAVGENAATLIEDDITQIPLADIGSPFGKTCCDLVLGGPPCQGFSVHRVKGSGVDDPRNLLIHHYFDVVQYLNPSVFLMENVPGLLWERHAAYLELFYEIALASGYDVYEPVVLDSRDFGVPQRRKRVFILGVVAGMPNIENWPPRVTHGNPAACAQDKMLKPWVPSAQAFIDAPKDDVNDVHMRHSPSMTEVFAGTPLDGGSRRESSRILKCHVNHDGHKDVYGRIDSRKPAPTMTTACINPSKGRFVHPTQHHGITVRQAARLQTFPDDFKFSGGIIAAGRQIGNAVPIQMGEAILQPIRRFIESQK